MDLWPRRKSNLWLLWVLACVLLVALGVFPVSTRLVRLATLALAGGVASGFLFLTWRFPAVRWALLALAGTATILICGPGYGVGNIGSLRSAYIRRLQTYEGVRYYWGGENRLGIDCSGLVRRAMIEALLERGVLTWNPALVRKGISMWWNDSSALEFKNNRNLTAELYQMRSVNSIDHSQVQPGDLVSNGIHIMAYIGDQRWIEADPTAASVIIVSAPARNGWFECPMTALRWTHFIE